MYKNQKGVTITILAFTVVVLLIVSSTIIIKANDYLAAKKLLNLENDIKILQEELPIYYEIHNSLPTLGQITESQINKMHSQLNTNDSGQYLKIDLSQLPNLKLNNGYGNNTNDYYVVNTGSLSVYYLDGLNIGGTMHYTITQNNSNLSSANDKLNGSINIIATSTSTTITANIENTYGINLRGCKFNLNNGTWTDLIIGNSYTFENLTPYQTYKINVQGIDNNGNIIIAENNGLEITTKRLSNGSYDSGLHYNTPDVSKLPSGTTKYVTWEEQGNHSFNEILSDDIPNNWYDYSSGKWANIKTTSEDLSLEAYWVWIPRFAYRLPESSSSTQINVIFVKNTGKTGVLVDGSETPCYYSTDTYIDIDTEKEITSNNTGLYTDKTIGSIDKWIIPPAFWWDKNSNGVMDEGEQLSGIWVAKYEASSNVPSAINGGNDNAALKVQIKPDVISWRGISLSNIYTVCRNIQTKDGALGTNIPVNSENALIDTHPSTNMEWSAIAILSQSKYGIFNTSNSTTYSDGRIWNNPNSNFITGTVGTTADAANILTENCVKYNSQYGSRASTTGNIYGVYDMSGGSWEYVMAVQYVNNTPAISYTGFASWPNSKYYNIYDSENIEDSDNDSNDYSSDYSRGKIGDLTSETLPTPGTPPLTSNIGWNGDIANFMYTDEPILLRGGASTVETGTDAGIFAFCGTTGAGMSDCSFRPVLICMNE